MISALGVHGKASLLNASMIQLSDLRIKMLNHSSNSADWPYHELLKTKLGAYHECSAFIVESKSASCWDEVALICFVWFGLVRFGSIRFSLVRFDSVCFFVTFLCVVELMMQWIQFM